jgi:hypothetical protein
MCDFGFVLRGMFKQGIYGMLVLRSDLADV